MQIDEITFVLLQIYAKEGILKIQMNFQALWTVKACFDLQLEFIKAIRTTLVLLSI